MLKIAQAGVLFVAASAFGTIVAPACAFAEEVVVHGEHHGDSGHGHAVERHETDVHHDDAGHHGEHREVVRERGHGDDHH